MKKRPKKRLHENRYNFETYTVDHGPAKNTHTWAEFLDRDFISFFSSFMFRDLMRNMFRHPQACLQYLRQTWSWMTSAFLTIESSSYLMCLKDSTILRLMYSICRDSPAQRFQVWCGCSCGSRPSSASGHKGDLTPRVWRVTGESPRRVDQARMLQNHPCSIIAISKEAVIARPASVKQSGSK